MLHYDNPIREAQSNTLSNPQPAMMSSSQLSQLSTTRPAQNQGLNVVQNPAMQANNIGTAVDGPSSSARQFPPEPKLVVRPIETRPSTKIPNLDEEEEMPSINLDSDSDQDEEMMPD